MKGIVFTEFLELVENKFGFEVLDKIITNSELENNGAYSAVGTYPHAEMIKLVIELSEQTGLSVPDLLYTYGLHFFAVLNNSYPHFIDSQKNVFTFLKSIDSYIHPEVLKLYPDAELPSFNTLEESKDRLVIEYESTRNMSDFAHGLFVSTIEHFKESIDIQKEETNDNVKSVKFIFSRRND
tara:strand:+ start:2050 stop:2595 length:546 start_codon:yes stop_codon:yes gene_type:complete